MGDTLSEYLKSILNSYFRENIPYNDHGPQLIDEQIKQIVRNIVGEAATIDQILSANYERIRATNLAKKQAEIQAKNNPQFRQPGNVGFL